MIGNLPKEINEAFIETIPIEFSIIDKNDKVVAWNKHETRIFKRPEAVVGRSVQNCHPKKSLVKVEQILNEMKEGKREKAIFWIDLKLGENQDKHKVMIQYLALKNKNGEYIGCLEATQDITQIQKITGEKRLLD
jgi:PAS domain S-box-containing protein